jgi:hypothetical protein
LHCNEFVNFHAFLLVCISIINFDVVTFHYTGLHEVAVTLKASVKAVELIFLVDVAYESLHPANVDSVSRVPEVHAAPVFMV